MQKEISVDQKNRLNQIRKDIESPMYVNTIFDHRQSHAVYGIQKNQIDSIKVLLKKQGCNKFRQVKSNGINYILCFKLN